MGQVCRDMTQTDSRSFRYFRDPDVLDTDQLPNGRISEQGMKKMQLLLGHP